MSFAEPGAPYFRPDAGQITSTKPFVGSQLTSAGLYRMFPITSDSPHEPWCHHFEWGACNCGPRSGEVFVTTQAMLDTEQSGRGQK